MLTWMPGYLKCLITRVWSQLIWNRYVATETADLTYTDWSLYMSFFQIKLLGDETGEGTLQRVFLKLRVNVR